MDLRSAVRRLRFPVLAMAAVAGAVTGAVFYLSASEGVAKPYTAATKNPRDESQAAKKGESDANAFASIAEDEISLLRAGITLEKWMKQRGRPEHWKPLIDQQSFACRTLARREALPSDRQITLSVSFYPAQAPTPAVFPVASAQSLIARGCTLGMTRVQTPARQNGNLFAQQVRRQFVRKFGQSIGLAGTGFWGAGTWKDAARWENASEIVSAYNPTPATAVPDPTANSVFVFARLPLVSRMEQSACCSLQEYRYRSIESAQLHRSMALAGVEPALSQDVTKLYEALFSATASPELAEQLENERLLRAVAPMLRRWLGAASTLPSTRRAAGLYVADRFLVAATDLGHAIGWDELWSKGQPELRSDLEELGARFIWDELDASYRYTNNWLIEARELDPEGAVGQMALLVSMARGGSPRLEENQDQDVFRTVITEGKWLLEKKPDSSTIAQVHFMIGDAYSDIVALAGGAEPDYGDPAKYKPEAESARKKALEHYRAGLAMDGQSENAKNAWLQAWRLSAGLLPVTRYVQIKD